MEDFDLQLAISHLKFALERASNQQLVDALGWGSSHFRLLVCVAHSNNANQTAIAKELGQTKASVSRQVKLLIDKGLVNQTVNSKNRRQNKLAITKKGHKELIKAKVVMKQNFKQLFTNLDPQTINNTVKLIKKITLSIETNSK